MQYILYNIYIYNTIYIYIFFLDIREVSLTLLEEQNTRTQKAREEYRARILFNENSTSTLVEELINISINLLSPAIQSVSISGQQAI